MTSILVVPASAQRDHRHQAAHDTELNQSRDRTELPLGTSQFGHPALIGTPPDLGVVAMEHANFRPAGGALRRYISGVYRTLVMFPKSADPAEVDTLIEGIASSFKASAGSEPITRSLGSLMGPGAKAGEAGWIFEADFLTLADAMNALGAEDFKESKVRTETLGSTIFLFEVGEV
jgi:hypothetical protein